MEEEVPGMVEVELVSRTDCSDADSGASSTVATTELADRKAVSGGRRSGSSYSNEDSTAELLVDD